MTSRYEKSGRTYRIELVRGERHDIAIEEHGSAIDDGLTFLCSPDQSVTRPLPRATEELGPRAESLLRRLQHQFDGCVIERLVVNAGVAIHRIEGAGVAQEWNDEQTRAHIALRHPQGAIELDLDDAEWDATARELQRMHHALTTTTAAPPALETIAFGPLVTASLLPELLRLSAPLPVLQRPRSGARDGDGKAIVAATLSSASNWPNRFRPSYRSAPVRLPHDVALETRKGESSADAEALAVIGPIVRSRDVLALRVLTAAGADFTLELPWRELQRSVRAIEEPSFWTPRLAGVWGQRVVLGR